MSLDFSKSKPELFIHSKKYIIERIFPHIPEKKDFLFLSFLMIILELCFFVKFRK